MIIVMTQGLVCISFLTGIATPRVSQPPALSNGGGLAMPLLLSRVSEKGDLLQGSAVLRNESLYGDYPGQQPLNTGDK